MESDLLQLVLYQIPCNALRLIVKAARGFGLYSLGKAGPGTFFPVTSIKVWDLYLISSSRPITASLQPFVLVPALPSG